MEDQLSFNSPRRTLSYSRNRRATLSVFEADNKASGVGVSGEHGPNPSEVYGFVGVISTVVVTVIFMLWAYVPDPWLHSIGIFSYPSKYWALALPTYAMVTVVTMFLFYIGLNFMATPPPISLNSIYDENSKDPVCFDPVLEGMIDPSSLVLILELIKSTCLCSKNGNSSYNTSQIYDLFLDVFSCNLFST